MTAADTPRILFQSVPPELKSVFKDLPGLHSYVDEDEEVHPSDHDLLVTFESSPDLDDSWHVLGFGMSSFNGSKNFHLGEPENRAREASVAEGAWPSEHRALIQRTILEEIASVPRRIWQTLEMVGAYFYPVTGGTLQGEVVPLVHLGREEGVYAMIANGGPNTMVWALPAETTDHREWLISILETLHKVDPDRFPGQAEWRMGDTWAPSVLQAALAARDEQVAERDRALAEADQRIAKAGAEVETERAAAATGPWRLLTENDNSLVEAVRDALEAFGFEVRELDEENHRKYKRRLEDLRVTVPGDQGVGKSRRGQGLHQGRQGQRREAGDRCSFDLLRARTRWPQPRSGVACRERRARHRPLVEEASDPGRCRPASPDRCRRCTD